MTFNTSKSLDNPKNRAKYLKVMLREGASIWKKAVLSDKLAEKKEHLRWAAEVQSHFIKLDEDTQEQFLELQDMTAEDFLKECSHEGVECSVEDFFIMRNKDQIFDQWDNQ